MGEMGASGHADARLAADFEKIVRSHARAVLSLALRLVGDANDAQDISQEVFISVWRVFERGAAVRDWGGYLRTAAARASLRHVAARKPPGEDCPDAVEDRKSPSPEHRASLQEFQDEFRRCMTRLPERQALAFALVKIQGVSCRECAEAMNCSEEAVRFLVHRAVHSLARLLRRHAPGR